MTPEQLEIIRKKFEALHPVPDGVKWLACIHDYNSTHYHYEDTAREYLSMWHGFLSAMSQEIELQLPKIEMSFGREPYPYVDCDNLISGLESQGYRMKK